MPKPRTLVRILILLVIAVNTTLGVVQERRENAEPAFAGSVKAEREGT